MIIAKEELLLRCLGFPGRVQHAHLWILNIAPMLELDNMVVQAAVAVANDTMGELFCVVEAAHIVAAACVAAAVAMVETGLSDGATSYLPNHAWCKLFDTSIDKVEHLARDMVRSLSPQSRRNKEPSSGVVSTCMVSLKT